MWRIAGLVVVLGCSTPAPRPCAADSDCTTPTTPACDDQGRCVACVGDEHCGDGLVCVEATCVAGCRGPPERFVCRPGWVCTGRSCHQSCATPASPGGDACPPGLRCEPTTMACVFCYDDSHCTDPFGRCVNNGCVLGCSAQNPGCFGCGSDEQCDGGRCLRSTHVWANTCVECLDDSSDNCPTGQFCDAYSCRPGCKGNADCVSGYCQPDHTCQ